MGRWRCKSSERVLRTHSCRRSTFPGAQRGRQARRATGSSVSEEQGGLISPRFGEGRQWWASSALPAGGLPFEGRS